MIGRLNRIIMYDILTILPFIIIISALSGTTMSTNMKMTMRIDIETLNSKIRKWNGTKKRT